MQEVRAAVIGTGVMGRKYAQMIAEGKAGDLGVHLLRCLLYTSGAQPRRQSAAGQSRGLQADRAG